MRRFNINIDLSFLIPIAICGMVAFGFHSCTEQDRIWRAETSYRECIRTAQTITLAGGHLECIAPKPLP